MSLPLLQTKLYVPSPRPQLVPRPAVTAKLQQGVAFPLTLVAAPAGFGKTTLISEWIAQSGRSAAWLSLDTEDNDPERFFVYLIAALRTVHTHIGETTLASLQARQLPATTTLLTPLINDLSQLADPVVLVLDDYHLITAGSIHEALTFLIEHLPPTLRLIITTRIDPPLPLARWRVRGQLAEIRADELRFGTAETTAFFNQIMGLSLSSAEITTLEGRTEGWIAALQLAGLSMQRRQNTAEFITAFSGSNRFIVDYLAEEVWQRLPVDTQRFLMQTALFERFCADLSEAVTGQPNAQATLTELEHANLFLIALDDERHWYRYHHLFRELLQQRLREQFDGTTLHALHRRAADWYVAHELTDEAIHHYLAATAVEQAADLIEEVGYETIGKSNLTRVRLWLEKLPGELVRARPRLVLWQAWVLNLTGQPALLEQWLQEAHLQLHALPAAVTQDMRAQLMTIHAYQTRRLGDLVAANAQLQQALATCTPDNLLTRSTINLNLGFNYWMAGELALAEQVLETAQREASSIQATHSALIAKGTQAIVAVAQGKLHRALQLCEETIQAGLTHHGGKPFPSTGYAYAVLGNILYERNELTTAERALRQALELGELMADGTMIRRAIFRLAPLCQLAGDEAAAQALWQRALTADDTVEEPQLLLQQVRGWLTQAAVADDQDALTQAIQWANRYRQQPDDTHPYRAAFAQTLVAWVELMDGRSAQALSRLAPLIAAARAAGHTEQLIQMLAIQAPAHAAVGDQVAAYTQLHHLLGLTAPQGYIRVYVDMGEPMSDLLESLRISSTDAALTDYKEQLLAAFAPLIRPQNGAEAVIQIETPSPTIVNRKSPIVKLIEPLSERELEILHLVAAGLSNSQLAEELIVTVGTVKKHLNNIYGKLGVVSRTQAIVRGRELGLLTD
ncbi:MAG: LuxR C-terminal-related transcriptional regulator [Caldilineaceae bacterium]